MHGHCSLRWWWLHLLAPISMEGFFWKAILWLVLGAFHSCWLNFFPFLLKINPLQTKAAQKNLNEIVASEDLAHSELVSRGVFFCFPGFQHNPIQPQRQRLGRSQEPAFSGGLSHVLLSLLGPALPYGKEARYARLPAASESDLVFLF